VDLLEVDLGTLAGQMADLLAKTDALWRAELDAVLAEGEIPRAEAGIADLRYLLGGPQFDTLFPKDRLLPALEDTLSGLGIPLTGQPNIHLDTEERPRKSPRAFCCPVRVPSDVRLVIMPRGGREDYNSLLHEAGHALHFANTDPDAPFAFRCLGDNSVTESYAFLLNMLVRSPAWLRDVARVEPDPAYLRFGRFYQLYYLRRYAAKLAYERELHAADTPGLALADRYVRILSDAMGVEIPAASYLSDVDDGFYCSCYLRAWVLEVHLRGTLVSEFGERWYASKDAGDYLKGLWRFGQQFTADEIAQRGLTDPQEFMPFAHKNLLDSDLVILLYHPELRGGLIEAGMAYAQKIPIWLCHRAGEHVSSSMRGCADVTIEYGGLDDLQDKLSNRLLEGF